MSGWADRASTWLRERLGSVGVATALAALIVLGVLAVLIGVIRASQSDFTAASMAVSVAEVTEDAIVATTALQRERTLASTLDDDELAQYHAGYEDAVTATDRAIQDLRDSWLEHRIDVPDTVTPTIGDVLTAEVSLGDFRDAARSARGESTFPLYNEIVALSVAATSELVKHPSQSTTAAERAMLVALLNVSEGLNTRRYLIQSALDTGGPLSEEWLLQLDVVSNNLNQSLLEARFHAEGDDLAAIEEVRTGGDSETSAEIIERLVDTGVATSAVSPPEWFEASSARIDQVDSLIPAVHDRVAVVADDLLGRAQRALWSRSIFLGALFLLTILVAINAVFATRERQEALTEYGQLSDGLRQWFAPASFPDSDSVDIAARYTPASVRTRSGGDWYDVYEVGDSLAVVIGDVAGHGTEATAQMAQLRNILRGQSTARTLDPAAQIDLLDKTISGSGTLATLTYGLLDVSKGEFVYTRAGHIPLMIRSAGAIRIEEEAAGPPVGSGVELRRQIKATRLDPGDVLILITDGLVEGVDRDIDLALDEIAKVLTEAGPAPEAMLDQLFGMSKDGPIDDAAALLITWTPKTPAQVT